MGSRNVSRGIYVRMYNELAEVIAGLCKYPVLCAAITKVCGNGIDNKTAQNTEFSPLQEINPLAVCN